MGHKRPHVVTQKFCFCYLRPWRAVQPTLTTCSSSICPCVHRPWHAVQPTLSTCSSICPCVYARQLANSLESHQQHRVLFTERSTPSKVGWRKSGVLEHKSGNTCLEATCLGMGVQLLSLQLNTWQVRGDR